MTLIWQAPLFLVPYAISHEICREICLSVLLMQEAMGGLALEWSKAETAVCTLDSHSRHFGGSDHRKPIQAVRFADSGNKSESIASQLFVAAYALHILCHLQSCHIMYPVCSGKKNAAALVAATIVRIHVAQFPDIMRFCEP